MPATHLKTNAANFQNALIAWYDANARDLPWRREPSLYKTVVSEFMLQQTQVKTVLPYFAAWLEAFPDFPSLAAAPEQSVLKSWEGLGYYTRARNLHKLAQQIAALPAQGLPTDAQSWQAFPGVGPYAAAAITSIAFNTPAAVVDGNVVRIISRLLSDKTPYKNSGDAAKSYRDHAAALLNTRRPGDHNQAVMELGATLCHKRSPQCLLCPVRALCQAQKEGIQEELPRLEKTKFEDQLVHRAWVIDDDKVLLHRIPDHSKRMKGLHELPDLEQLKLGTAQSEPILTRKRSITKYRITEHIHRLSKSELPPISDDSLLWVRKSDIAALPFSGPHRRWIEELFAL